MQHGRKTMIFITRWTRDHDLIISIFHSFISNFDCYALTTSRGGGVDFTISSVDNRLGWKTFIQK